MPKNVLDSIRKRYIALQDKETKTYQNFIKTNPNSLVSAHALNIYATTWGKEKSSELYESFSDVLKASEYAKNIKQFIDLNKEIQIGDTFVDFELNDPNETPKKLSSLRRKVTLLEFWASWCGPCRAENPNLVKTYEKYNPKGFEIFAVSLDNNKKGWLDAIKKDNLNWIQTSDLNGDRNKAALIYGVSGIPDNFLIDENGIIVARNLRGEELNEKLSELLK